MGTDILAFYRNKIKDSWKLAFSSAFLIGLIVHMYRFTNVLPNHDSVYNFYSSQNMVGSGRWFLGIACAFSSYFDLPWVIGLFSLAFMGITAAILAEVFRMKNPVLIVVSSGLLVTFPAITATFFYEFTADGYMLAMALAALSVYLSKLEFIARKHWPKLVLSAVCICLSCAIYQAYVSFAFILAVCYFMTELLENKADEKTCCKWIGLQILIYGLALAAYYLIWQICLRVAGISSSTYMGMDTAGISGVSQIVQGAVSAVKYFVRFFLEWNFLRYGLTVYSALNILFLTGFAAVLVYALFKSGCVKRKLPLALVLLCVVSIPFGCCIWTFVSPAITYRTLMLQSVCILFIFLGVLCDRWISGKKLWSSLILLLLTATVFNNSLAANMCYNYMHQCYEKTYADAVELNTRVHLLDDGTIRYVAIYGELDTWAQEDFFDHSKLRQLGGWKYMDLTILSPQFLSLYTDFSLSYYRINGLEYPVVENEPNIPAPYDWEFRFPSLPKDQMETLAGTQQVQDMPVWPARDSVQVIGDTVVIKLSEFGQQETP